MAVSSHDFRADIQGLRALAVLGVILFHYNPELLPGGYIGVDVFFVISGFLITSILLNKKTKAEYHFFSTIKQFYASRFTRIAPAYFVMLIVVSLLVAILFIPNDHNIYSKSLKQALYFNSNNYFAGFGDYFAPANYEQSLLHTWSLAIEIQFYLLIPFVVLLLPLKKLTATFILLIILLTSIAEYRLRFQGVEQVTYYSLYARVPEFLLGGLAALNMARFAGGGKMLSASLSLVGLLMIVGSLSFMDSSYLFPGLAALLPALGAALLIVSGHTDSPVSKILSLPVLVWLGAISYSLYLWHWPILSLMRYYTGSEALTASFTFAFIFLTLLFATISYYVVETPMRKPKEKRSNGWRWMLLLLGSVATTKAGATVNTWLSPASLSVEYTRYADPDTICHGKIVGDCLKGDLNSGREVLVLGDSHAAMLNIFFDDLGKQLGFKARVITASSCVTIPEFDYHRIPEWAQKSCIAQINEARRYIDNSKIIFLAGAWQFHTQYPTFNDPLIQFINNIKPQQTLYVLAQIPKLSNNPQRVLRLSGLGFPMNVSLDKTYLEANHKIELMLQHHKNINFLRLNELHVFNKAPLLKLSDGNLHLIYFDDNHLNEVGVKYYAHDAASLIQKKLN
ncbi:MAG: acyltransferase [Betaproteobacteria bacterium HGW-Betaproteobacteria-22]|nr:MAG: acyltransferase [Betaproteobacteria bacterium HGW-Betaproteobacteria-22]